MTLKTRQCDECAFFCAEREALWVNGVMTGAEIALARAMDICRPVPGPEPRDWQLHRARIALREFLCDQLQKQNVELLEAEARRRWADKAGQLRRCISRGDGSSIHRQNREE